MDMDSSTGANRLGQAIAKRIVKHMDCLLYTSDAADD